MRLVEIAKLNMGQSPPSASYNDIAEGLPFYQGKTDFGFINPVPRKYCNEPSKIADKGDILISVRAPVGPVNIADDKCCIGRGLAAIKASQADQLFLYFNLIYQESFIASLGTGSTFKAINKSQLENVIIPNISLPEQRKIAHVLSTIQKAIEQQDKLILTTTELKKALMQKLFTEGTRGEPQKETEIGLVPESWGVVEFPKFVLLQRGKDLTKKNFIDGDIPVAGSNGVIGYHNQSFVKAPGVTVGRSGSCGIVNYYEKDFWAHNTSLYVKDFNGNDEMFCFYYLQLIDIGKFKTGASVPTLDRNSLNTFEVPVPKKEEQKEIAKYIQTIESKIESGKNKKQTLADLFKTLLHELMTGQRRVHELEFEKMDVFQ